MSSRILFLLPIVGLWLVPSAPASDLAYVKCAVNQDRVWVYESLGSFDVEARLRCGAPVEILSRIRGYVRIRTESGVEGWVPDSTFPDLPALPDDTQKPLGSIALQSVAAAAAAARKPAPVSAVAGSVATEEAISAAAKPAEPVVVAVKAPAATAAPASSTAAPRPAPAVTVAAVSAPAQAVATPAPAIRIEPLPVKASAEPKPLPSLAKTIPAKASSINSTHAKPAPSVTKKSETGEGALAPPIVHSAPPAPVPMPTAAPAKPSMETISASPRDSATIMTATAKPAVADDEEYPDTQPENESADPNCRIFFAAYGLAPSQYKWMAESRRKEFSGICPAPDVAHVDYVVLFTHDSDAYTNAMPVPVHTDRNGFSDFSPLTTADTALVSASEVEKARYEFAWVFHVKRGAFDPSKFSPRRKPQFTTYVKGSRASSRALEETFNYVQTQGVNR